MCRVMEPHGNAVVVGAVQRVVKMLKNKMVVRGQPQWRRLLLRHLLHLHLHLHRWAVASRL